MAPSKNTRRPTKTRKLVDGRTATERDQKIPLVIDTRCPGKWLFVDLETGDVWRHNEKHERQHFVSATAADAHLMKRIAANLERRIAEENKRLDESNKTG